MSARCGAHFHARIAAARSPSSAGSNASRTMTMVPARSLEQLPRRHFVVIAIAIAARPAIINPCFRWPME
jgi:hypothetical protein